MVFGNGFAAGNTQRLTELWLTYATEFNEPALEWAHLYLVG
jgi:hypothetical protein